MSPELRFHEADNVDEFNVLYELYLSCFSFETEDGIQRQENGELKEALDEENKPHSVVVVRGSYSYTDSEGKPQSISYYADETGFHAEGDSIPKANSR